LGGVIFAWWLFWWLLFFTFSWVSDGSTAKWSLLSGDEDETLIRPQKLWSSFGLLGLLVLPLPHFQSLDSLMASLRYRIADRDQAQVKGKRLGRPVL
jgi:hypothetical protein